MQSIIFMGTPDFSVTVLDGLIKAGYDIKAVVTQPDKKIGRKQILTKTPTKIAAQKHNIPVYQPVKLAGSKELETLINLHADFIVTAAYGQFLPTKFLNSAKIAAVNVHGSLLPKYRGGAPIQYSLMNGDKQTGVTIMKMVKKMDAGDMYAQESIDIQKDDNAGSIFLKLSVLGRDLLLKTLPKIADGSVKTTKQDENKVIFSPNISKTQEQITKEMSAEDANNLIRALNPDPGAYIIVKGQRMKIWKAEVSDETTSMNPGYLVDNKKDFAISFAAGTVLNLIELQPAGKKKMNVKNFLNGQAKKYRVGEQIIDE